jgi:cold shock CspA family protein
VPALAQPARRRLGTVTAFDDHAGIGTVLDDTGTETFLHCTAIADGSRTVAVGARVRYRVVAGRRGCWEAAEVEVVHG